MFVLVHSLRPILRVHLPQSGRPINSCHTTCRVTRRDLYWVTRRELSMVNSYDLYRVNLYRVKRHGIYVVTRRDIYELDSFCFLPDTCKLPRSPVSWTVTQWPYGEKETSLKHWLFKYSEYNITIHIMHFTAVKLYHIRHIYISWSNNNNDISAFLVLWAEGPAVLWHHSVLAVHCWLPYLRNRSGLIFLILQTYFRVLPLTHENISSNHSKGHLDLN